MGPLNATLRSIFYNVRNFLDNAGLASDDSQPCALVLGFPAEEVTALPTVAIDRVDQSVYPVGLGRHGGGRSYLIAFHIWGNNIGQCQEIEDTIIAGLHFENNEGSFQVHDWSQADPLNATPLGVGQPILEDYHGTENVQEDVSEVARVVAVVPILLHLASG